MINFQRPSIRLKVSALLLLSLCILGLNVSCKTNNAKASEAIENYMRNHGASKIQSDFLYTTNDFPGKAYAGVTVTYNFADSKGSPQQEFLGFILSTNTSEWKVESSTGYTTDEKRAHAILAGKK